MSDHPTPDTTQRRLATILAADVVGFSRLMGADEEGTLNRIRALRRDIIEPNVQQRQGRIVKTTGDGFLIAFESPVEAVRCALAVQQALISSEAAQEPSTAIQVRVGINLGDILIEPDGDIFGDGVNVAARLEQLAEPEAVLVSGGVYEVVRDKLPVAFEDRGEQAVKNIARPVRVYAVGGTRPATAEPKPLPLPDKPSIAVLPFTNMSGDPEQEYFADGVVEDILTALSRFQALLVIARNSSFTYKGRSVDVKQVGRELGVRYVLEGSVRKAGDRVRITGQLIDTTNGAHLWANRFEGALEDVFDLQEKVAADVVCAVVPTVEQAEIERARRKPTHDLDSYDFYLRAIACLYDASNTETIIDALSYLREAITRDPTFAAAYGRAASCYNHLLANFRDKLSPEERAEAVRLASMAVRLGQHDAVALSTGGHVLTYIGHDFERGSVAVERAVALNPNLLTAVRNRAWVRLMSGDPSGALEDFSLSARLNPLDPWLVAACYGRAFASFHLGEFADGYEWAEKALRLRPSYTHALAALAINAVGLGRMEDARASVRSLQGSLPELPVEHLADLFPMRLPLHRDRIAEALAASGLPR